MVLVPIVPTYRALTIVGTVLSRDGRGDMVHRTVSDNTAGEEFVLCYELLPASRPKS